MAYVRAIKCTIVNMLVVVRYAQIIKRDDTIETIGRYQRHRFVRRQCDVSNATETSVREVHVCLVDASFTTHRAKDSILKVNLGNGALLLVQSCTPFVAATFFPVAEFVNEARGGVCQDVTSV